LGYILSRQERETIINYNEEEDLAELYTASPSTMRRMDKMCSRFPGVIKCVRRNEDQATYELPKRLVGVRGPRMPRALSKEQIDRQREIMRELTQKRCLDV
jgi:hypothetical protein